jgi:hypothetical protein
MLSLCHYCQKAGHWKKEYFKKSANIASRHYKEGEGKQRETQGGLLTFSATAINHNEDRIIDLDVL